MHKKIREHLCFLAALALVLPMTIGGCHCTLHSYGGTTAQPIYVATAPPLPKAETKTPAPSGNHAWVDGHWDWSEADKNWVWVEGSWKIPPSNDWEWVPPKYEDREDIGVYTPGHWSAKDAGRPSQPDWNKPKAVEPDAQPKDKGEPAKPDFQKTEKVDVNAQPKDKGEPAKPDFQKTEKVDAQPKDKGEPAKPDFQKTEKVDVKAKKKQGELKSKDDEPENPDLQKKKPDLKKQDPKLEKGEGPTKIEAKPNTVKPQ
jgi:hypothetical protein